MGEMIAYNCRCGYKKTVNIGKGLKSFDTTNYACACLSCRELIRVEINDDASIVWCFYYEAGKTVLCSIDENGEITAISDKDENMDIRKMYWDSDTQKLYMYGDNTLTALSKDGEQEVISKKCKRLSKDNYDYPGILTFTDSNDRDYVSVFGQFVMIED